MNECIICEVVMIDPNEVICKPCVEAIDVWDQELTDACES